MMKPKTHDHHHDHHHDHKHDHDHRGHHHHVQIQNEKDISNAFIIGGVLNFIFVIFELIFGALTGSVSLVADAVHNFSDVVALFLSWIGFKLNKSKPSVQFTYGLKKMSLMITFFNSITLVLSLFFILYQAYQRFLNPQPLSESTIIVVAAIGILVNFASAYLFRKNHSDVNVKGAYLHLVMDALISFGVVLAGVAIKITGLTILDPIVGCLIVIFIARGTWSLFKESFVLLIGGVPLNINLDHVRKFVLERAEVDAIHDLHIWSLSSSEVALTVHLKMKSKAHPGDLFLKNLNHDLQEKFNISHATIQIEVGDLDQICHLEDKC